MTEDRPWQDESTGQVPEAGGSEPVWSCRGSHLRSGEFADPMGPFFRAGVQRANVWRYRLDTTTNWAVVTTAPISFANSRTQAEEHRLIILNVLLVTLFPYIEARRHHHYYELWSYRVRFTETDFFATMLAPPFRAG